MAGEVGLALGFRELLDGVTEHGPGHDSVSRRSRVRACDEGRRTLQVGLQGRFVLLAGFAEEPAHRFVDEVVGVVQEDVGDGEGVGELTVPNEGHGTDYADTLFPEAFSVTGQVVEERPVFVQEPDTEKRVAGKVYEVPVVDESGMG